jgi:hypothetical protein
MKKRLLYVSPHLSTGGLPQYLYKQIQHFKNDYEIEVVEISDLGGDAFVVQKNKIKSIVPIHTLGSDKSGILKVIQNFNPHIIHFQEIPEFNLSNDILDKIFDNGRDYYIITSTHGSYTDPNRIKYHPDRYVLVSEWSRRKFEVTGVDTQIWEYPIEDYVFDKSLARKQLGFEDGWMHVLNVGLFAPGKNQKEIFQIAEELKDYKIKFHFVGNQAGNFENYWKPLMETKPDNCIVWGERDDVDTFYQAADLFYFSSTLELNPLSIKEALSYKLPSFFRRLETYLDTYDNNNLVTYIDNDLEKTKRNLLKKLEITPKLMHSNDDVVSIVLSYADNDFRKKLLKGCLESIKTQTILSSHYPIDTEFQLLTDWSIYERENPLLFNKDFNKYGLSFYTWRIDSNGVKHTKEYEYEHSYAVYKLIEIGVKHAKSMGKKYINIVNYDYEVMDDVLMEHLSYLKNGYDMVFYKQKDGVSYSTGFFSGNVDSLMLFFNKIKSFDEFYSNKSPNMLFEYRVYEFYKNSELKIKEFDIIELSNRVKVDQEGILDFSNSNKNK